MSISQLKTAEDGKDIYAADWNSEIQQLITEVNVKQPLNANLTSLSALAVLGLGTANKHRIMNAGATAEEWASPYKIGTFTRDDDAASGDVSYTGVGFKPSAIIFLCAAASAFMSFGFDDATNHYYIFHSDSGGSSAGDTMSINAAYGGGSQTAIVKTFDADGFTLTWTKQSSPSGNHPYIHYLALR
jgi:hypothetical protein